MILNTKYHGTKEYTDEEIIFFQKGLPGFENRTKFILFTLDENEIFSILHSIEDPALGFVLVSPFLKYIISSSVYSRDPWYFVINIITLPPFLS